MTRDGRRLGKIGDAGFTHQNDLPAIESEDQAGTLMFEGAVEHETFAVLLDELAA